ncbi:MAG: 6-bladed beta-propeller [Gemmatimonadales bacterium]|nr:MAG: 6-bladed beta-propeller [Gemmatimonadales bacterium]
MRKGTVALLPAMLIVSTSCSEDSRSLPAVEAPNRVAVPTVVAGAVDGPGALGRVAHVEMGRSGEILVADGQAQAILVFDQEGEYSRTIGRAGSGPGEFTQVTRIGWTQDTLWTSDPFASRIHLWDADLRFVRTITTMMPAPPPGALGVFTGAWMAESWVLGVPAAMGPHPGIPLLLVSEDGSEIRELPPISTEGQMVPMEFSSGPFDVSNPWSDAPLWLNAADGESIVIVGRRVAEEPDRAEFMVTRIGVNGDTLLHRGVEYAPEAMDPDHANDRLGELAEQVARARSIPVPEALRVISANLTPPAFFPPVSELVPGRDGTIWLRREMHRADSVDWHVFTADAEPLSRVRLPVGFDVQGAELDRVWGVVRDSLEIPFVQIYDIHSPSN